MSLIERAAERLEKLGRTPPQGPSSELPAPDGESDSWLPTPERLVQALQEDASRHEPFLGVVDKQPASVPGSAEGPTLHSSRYHELDLARLNAEGFITPEAPSSRLANEFRVIKRPLIANVKGKSATPIKRANLIMITSAMPGEGKSFTAINLAMSIAMELDSTVLLVDGDVAGPSLSRLLHLPKGPGLIELLSAEKLGVGEVMIKTNVPKLSLIQAGTRHERSTELLASESMNRLLDEMAARYPDRIIVFDSPPLLPTTESRELATHMGQIVVVVEAERTTHRQVTEAFATIESCPVVMTVLNKAVNSDVGTYYGHYGY